MVFFTLTRTVLNHTSRHTSTGGIALDPTYFNTTNATSLWQAWAVHDAYQEVGMAIAELGPDIVLLSTPHGVADLSQFMFYLNPQVLTDFNSPPPYSTLPLPSPQLSPSLFNSPPPLSSTLPLPPQLSPSLFNSPSPSPSPPPSSTFPLPLQLSPFPLLLPLPAGIWLGRH